MGERTTVTFNPDVRNARVRRLAESELTDAVAKGNDALAKWARDWGEGFIEALEREDRSDRW